MANLRRRFFLGFPQLSHNGKSDSRQNKGQIVVEYILLLMIAVILAATIVRVLVNRNPDNPGAVISAWDGLIHFISDDMPDDANP